MPALHALWMASAARCKCTATGRGPEIPGPRSAKTTTGADPRTHGDGSRHGIAPRDEEHPERGSHGAHRTTSGDGDRGDGRFWTQRGSEGALRRAIRIAGRAGPRRADKTRSTSAQAALDHMSRQDRTIMDRCEHQHHGADRLPSTGHDSVDPSARHITVLLLCTARSPRDSASSQLTNISQSCDHRLSGDVAGFAALASEGRCDDGHQPD